MPRFRFSHLTRLLLAVLTAIVSLTAEGIRYEQRQLEGPNSVHILFVDPVRSRIELTRALNNGIGRETVSSMARRRGAKAAVNAGFFVIGTRLDGMPAGILKIEEDWYSDPRSPRGALGWSKDGPKAVIGRLKMKWELLIDGTRLPISGINRPQRDSSTVLYTAAFHRSTLTDPGGREYSIDEGRLVATAGNDSEIPEGGFVYWVGPSAQLDRTHLKPGQAVTVDAQLLPQGESDEEASRRRWGEAHFIVGGAGVLIRANRKVDDFAPGRLRDGFVRNKHPRTAVGLRADSVWVVAVVDGRQPGKSVGMTLSEMADLMHSLGCQDALNLDGGGSSTFFFQGKVLNSPSDFGNERPVSDAILFFERP